MNKLHIDLKRPLALLLAILMCVSVLPAVAPAAKADAVEISYLNSTFTENSDGTVTIKQFDTEAGITEISIPKEVTVNAGGDKKVVSAIGESAFASANLTSVAIAEDSEIKSIGASAFVSNPFTDFPFPASLETMGERAFESSGLETIDLSKTKLEIIPQIAFQFVQAKAIKFPTAGTLKRIENNAFYDNKINTTVVFPAGIEYIGFSAFYRTTKTNVGCLDFSAYAPGSIETGGTSCHNISQVWGDPDGKNAASNSPFIFNYETGVIVGLKEDCATRDYDGWDHTTGTLTIPKQIDGVEVTAIYGGAFNRYPSYDNLKAITFEDGITAIESFPPYSFAAPNAKEINNIPASVKTLEIRSMCLNLAIEELSFPGVTNVGSMVFEGCNNLKKITFGSTSISGRAIASDAFRNINGNKLKDIYFSVPKDTVNGAPWLCYYADIHWSDDVTPRMVRTGTDKYGHKWEYASSAKSILMYAGTLDELRDEETGRSDLILPSEITDDETGETYIIENVGFGSTRVFDFVDPEKTEVHLTSISADEGVKTIERGAFNDTAIDVIDFSNSTIQSILVQAFQRSKSTTILLPDSLLVLGDSAFAGKNQQFTEITIPGNVKTLHAKAFLNVENLTVNIMMKRYARSDDPGFTQGEWRTGDTVYKKAPSTIVNNAPFSAKSPKIYYVDSPRPEPEFEVTANPTNNTAEIVVNGYTSYIFFIIKGEGEEPSGIEYLGTDDGSSETATGNITKSNPEAQGTENPAVSNPVIVTSNGTYKFALTMTRSATQNSPDAKYERFEGSLYNAVVDAFHTVTYAKDEHVSAGASPVDAASYVKDYLVTAASAEGLSLDGYVFQGWTYTDAKGRDILVKPGQTFKMPNENVTLTETWIKASEVDANVNFHAGEGATFGNGPDLTLGAKIGAPIADVLKNYAPEKPGYKLLGWSTDSEATAPNTYVVPSVESVGTETPEVHLYAVWEIRNDIVVTFDGNGGKIGESYTLTSAPGTFGADLTVPEATRDGYTFVEWNTQADGRGETLVAKYPADNAIYYAIWKADTHKVTFSAGANGTFKDASAVTELEGIPTDTQLMAAESWDGFKVPEIQANEGYVFSGWQAPDGVLYASKEVETYTMGATDAEFVAQYVEIGKSTVNFDYVGGSDDAGATNKVVTGFVGADLAEADRPTGLTKTGYQFNGWTVDGESVNVTTLKFPEQGKITTVVANWIPNNYSVVFHNGDTTKTQSGFTYDREKTLTKLSALGFTEEGSEFRGWATEENGNPVYTDGQKVKNLTATDKATVDLYAVWEFTDVTVTFVANDGVYATKTGKAGDAIEKPEDPTKEGYEFDGWYDGETKLSFEGDDAAKFPERNAIYIAKFVPAAQTLKFVVDSAKGEVTGTLEFTVLTGEKLSTAEGFAVPNVTAKEGFTFNGWMAEDGTLYNETNLPNVTMIAGGMTFTAQFTEQNKGTIIFNFNGGKVGEETMAQFSGTPNTAFAETAPAPEMTGYTLTGWSEDIAALTYPAEGETKTVTAQWTANTYKVVFHDGDATKEQTGFTYDEEKALDANTFEKAGSTFKGWAISPDGAVAYLDGATVKNLTAEADGSFDLYAVWEADQVTVTFIANGAEFAQKTGNVGELIEDPGTPDAPAGYEFDGWYDGATKLDFATAVYPDAPKTYTAKFNATKQKVTFTVGEGGHLVNASAQVEFEVETDAKLTDVTAPEVVAEDGYTFVGWVKDGVTYTAESLKNLTMGSEDITFNAQFTSKTASTIIFNANGGAFEDGASIKIETGTAGTAFNGTVPTPTREGYNFTGWLPEIGTAITFPAEGETLIYTAQWTAIEYTVKYVVETPDGAPEGTTVSAAPAEANYTEGTAVTLAAAPEINNGYVFAGWTASGALTGTYEAGAEITMPVGNVTFTATFTAPAKVIIGFNLGADDAVMTNPALAAQELKVGEKATVPEVSRPGYKLAGWVSSDISFANLDADATETPAAVTGKNVVYTAQWTAVESDVKFEAGEHGTLEGGTEFQVATGEKLENVTAPEVKPEAGYTFLGWKSSLGGLYQADEIADIVMVAEGITFTAQYAQNKNTAIYYDFNGGIADGKTSAFWTGVAGTEFTEELPVPEKTGYTLTAPEKPASFPDDGVTVIKAEWTAVEYNVTYVVAVPEGAPEGTTVSEAPAASTTASDSTVTLAAAPTASNGYEFVGWVASGALSGTYEAGATVTMPAGDVTFTAQFAAPAKVLFAFNLGAEDASAEGATEAEVRVGETAQLPTNLQRPGYEFDGWKSSNEAYADLAKDAAATPAAVKGENVVYTAQWTPIDNTVTFVADANSKLEGETSFTVKTGAKLEGELPTVVADEGYTFNDQWVCSKGGIFTTAELADYVVTENVTFTAVVVSNTQLATDKTLTFDANGGTDAPAPVTVAKGSTVSLGSFTATAPEGKIFIGWAESKDATEIIDSIVLDSDKTVYAIYKDDTSVEGKYTVTFVAGENGTFADEAPSYEVKVDVNGTVAADAIVEPTPNEGFTFVGWTVEGSDGILSSAAVAMIPVKGDVTYTAAYNEIDPENPTVEYTLTFDAGEGKDAPAPMKFPAGTKVQLTGMTATAPTGRTFNGWTLDGKLVTEVTLDSDITVVASYTVVDPVGPFTVTFSAGDHGTMSPETYSEEVIGGETVKSVPAITANTDYTFEGWTLNGGNTKYSSADILAMKITGDSEFVAYYSLNTTNVTYIMPNSDVTISDPVDIPELFTSDHVAYMRGSNGKFRPNDELTRAEAAQALYNLLALKYKTYEGTVSFKDVSKDKWYYDAVMTLAELDVIKGYPDGTFKPEAKITRAEFISLCARFFDAQSGEIGFTDVPESHWAYSYIVTARQKGWITGYPDDTFRPNENIKRTEVVSIINNMLGRTPDNDYIDAHEAELKTFSDVPKTHWNYYGIIEASNAHDAKYEEGKEIWK